MPQRSLLVLAATLMLGAGICRSQVTAHQGTSPPSEIVHFASPMILDLPLPDLGSVDAGSQAQLPKVRMYICDRDVSLLNLAIAKQYKGPRKARSLQLVISGSVFVAESYDRRVDIDLRLKSGDEVLGTQRLRNHKTEEGRSTPFRLFLPVDESRVIAALAAQPAPTLEVTLTVRDDS